MENKLNIGDEVLIFRYIPEWGPRQDYERYIKGQVINRKDDYLSVLHGSDWNVVNYTVVGEDDRTYYGNYIMPRVGNSFFMKVEDYERYLESTITKNENKINELQESNNKLLDSLNRLKEEEKNKTKVLTNRR